MAAITAIGLVSLIPSFAPPTVSIDPFLFDDLIVTTHPEVWVPVAFGLPVLAGITDFFGATDAVDPSGEDQAEEDLFGEPTEREDTFGTIDNLEGDETSSDIGELEGRLSQLETDVADIASSLKTVRNENNEIGQTVQEVESHVRDLLDIYEMVTRDVNPFVDESVDRPAVTGGNDAIGLFDGVEDSAQGPTGGADGFEQPLDGSGRDESPGGKSFEDLKAEYHSTDSGDANANDSAAVDGSRSGDDPAVQTGPSPDFDPATGENLSSQDGPDDHGDVGRSDPAADGQFVFLGDRDSRQELSPHPSRPHLQTFPREYLADLTAIEWLEELVEIGDRDGATAALDYYVDIGWISDEVRTELVAMLAGLGEPSSGTADDDRSLGAYGLEAHRRSLGFISELASDTDRELVLERIDEPRRRPSDGP